MSDDSSYDSDGLEKPKKVKVKKKKELLSTGLVYQPTFNKVVKESSTSLAIFKDMFSNISKKEKDSDKANQRSSANPSPAATGPRSNNEGKASAFGKSSGLDNISVGKISEVDSISQSSSSGDLKDKSLRVNSNQLATSNSDDASPDQKGSV